MTVVFHWYADRDTLSEVYDHCCHYYNDKNGADDSDDDHHGCHREHHPLLLVITLLLFLCIHVGLQPTAVTLAINQRQWL